MAVRAGPDGATRRDDLARALEYVEPRAIHWRQQEPRLCLAKTIVSIEPGIAAGQLAGSDAACPSHFAVGPAGRPAVTTARAAEGGTAQRHSRGSRPAGPPVPAARQLGISPAD